MKKLGLIVLALLLTACSPKTDKTKPTVVTTFFPYHSMVSSLSGDEIELKNIMPLSMEVHDFEPSPKDIALLEEADLLIAHGAHLEDWLEQVVGSLKNKDLKVVYMADAVELLPQDPHTWLNPENALKQMEVIKQELLALNPSSSSDIEAKYTALKSDFDNLINDYSKLKDYPGKHVIVDHKAYNYLLSPLGLIQESYMGEFHSEEPTAKQIEATIQFIKDQNIKVIYETNHAESKIVDVLVKETGVQVLKLDTLEVVHEDDLEATYVSLMKLNLESLLEGLQQ